MGGPLASQLEGDLLTMRGRAGASAGLANAIVARYDATAKAIMARFNGGSEQAIAVEGFTPLAGGVEMGDGSALAAAAAGKLRIRHVNAYRAIEYSQEGQGDWWPELRNHPSATITLAAAGSLTVADYVPQYAQLRIEVTGANATIVAPPAGSSPDTTGMRLLLEIVGDPQDLSTLLWSGVTWAGGGFGNVAPGLSNSPALVELVWSPVADQWIGRNHGCCGLRGNKWNLTAATYPVSLLTFYGHYGLVHVAALGNITLDFDWSDQPDSAERLILLVNPDVHTVSWANVSWLAGSAPTLTPSAVNYLEFIRDPDQTTPNDWKGRVLGAGSSPTTTRGDLIVRGASADQRLPIGASGRIFRSDGTDPAWVTQATALADILTTRGDVLRRGSSAPERLALGDAGTFLKSDGTDAAYGKVVYYKDVYIPAAGFLLHATNFPGQAEIPLSGGTVKDFVLVYDDTTEQSADCLLRVPADIDTSGSVTFQVDGRAASAPGASKVTEWVWGQAVRAAGEDVDPGSFTNHTSGPLAVDPDLGDLDVLSWQVSVASLGWLPGDNIKGRLTRDTTPSSGTDVTGDYYVLGLLILIPCKGS